MSPTRTAHVTVVRIGEQAASASHGDVLSSVGLGSCIGLALLDAKKGIDTETEAILAKLAGETCRASPYVKYS